VGAGSGARCPSTLRVRLLGGFEVEGVEPRAVGSRKARLLAKRLAVAAGAAVPVGELVEAVWAGDPPVRAPEQLSVLVSRIRAAYGADRVRRSDAGYQLNLDWLDVLEVERRADEVERRLAQGQFAAATAAAQSALVLARGPLLPEEDATWTQHARAGMARTVLRIRLCAAQAALAVGDPIGARFTAEQALQEEPYDEAALRLLMRAHSAAGNGGAALAAYAEFRTRLGQDLGVDPSDETDAVYLAVLSGGSVQEGRRATPFVGRALELRQLDYVLQKAVAGGRGAVVVEAPPGTGKSALLTTWARSPAVTQALCVVGRCNELGCELPLQPVIDGLLRHLKAFGADPAAVVGDDAGVLLPLLGYAAPGSRHGGTGMRDLDGDRRALFRALLELLRRLAGPRPVVLVIDDLHLAAQGTTAFLAHVLRWGERVAVVAACRPGTGVALPEARVLPLGPLGEASTAELVGHARAARVHERTGGHPLFLAALGDADDTELPQSVIDAVHERLTSLGDAAATVQVAALLGRVIDVDLVSRIGGREVAQVLDDLDVALRLRLLEPRDMTLAFAHDVVREVVERTTSPVRAAALHAAAVGALSRRQHVEPLVLARHARLAGDVAVAAAALVQAADVASARHDLESALTLLDDAVSLLDGVDGRLLRARLRLAAMQHAAAREDALRALELGGGAAALEVAGWVSYYVRDYEAARRFADEGVARSSDPALRASCLALAGRIRHTCGELDEASERLQLAVSLAPPEVRGVAQVWHAGLLVHRGDAMAIEEARRGLLEPVRRHPFATLHGHFVLAHALGTAGRWADALGALDSLDLAVERMGDAGKRFEPVAANTRGWLLRAVGALDQAAALHEAVAARPVVTEFLEPHYVSLLDLAEDRLVAGDVEQAAGVLEQAQGIRTWEGSMSWRQRMRLDLVEARWRLLVGDAGGAEHMADSVLRRAASLGDRRYRARGELLRATAYACAGSMLSSGVISRTVVELSTHGGPDAWRDLAGLARAARSDAVQREAEQAAASLVTQLALREEVDSDACASWMRGQLDACGN
jgi:DNA-binding SARP family transcriptional activator/tetratricopeptide (TPR) repeat protein